MSVATAVETLKRFVHPDVAVIRDTGVTEDGLPFFTMDFVEGENLRDFYRVRGRFAVNDATRVAIGMLEGLSYAFGKGITHRDLKMSNIIVSSEGEGRLVDFGLAGLGGDDGDDANPRTIDYAGLERATAVRKDDTRSDIFFVGCIFYQLLSGVAALCYLLATIGFARQARWQFHRPKAITR